MDQGLTFQLKSRDSNTLTQLKLKNGDMIYVGNKEASMASI